MIEACFGALHVALYKSRYQLGRPPSPTSSEASGPLVPDRQGSKTQLSLARRGSSCHESQRSLRKERDRLFKTLRRTWPQDYPRPQFAFRMSMLNVSCNSHYFSQIAASFIDARAE